MLDCQKAALDLIRAIRAPYGRLRAERAHLADELMRAADSVLLNTAEGAGLRGKRAVTSFNIARGSAGEVVSALQGAEAHGILTDADIAPALALCDRIGAMLYRLCLRA